MDQLNEKKEKQFANNHIIMLINNQKWISFKQQESFTFIEIQIEYRRPVFLCLQ